MHRLFVNGFQDTGLDDPLKQDLVARIVEMNPISTVAGGIDSAILSSDIGPKIDGIAPESRKGGIAHFQEIIAFFLGEAAGLGSGDPDGDTPIIDDSQDAVVIGQLFVKVITLGSIIAGQVIDDGCRGKGYGRGDTAPRVGFGPSLGGTQFVGISL